MPASAPKSGPGLGGGGPWRHDGAFRRRVAVVALQEQPWARVRDPAPVAAAAVELAAMTDAEFAEQVRHHLMPREDQPGGRARWTRLWTLLGEEQLCDHTFDVLEDFLDTTEAALAGGALGDAEAARARKFRDRCQEAWSRLQRAEDDRPLGWAGKAAEGFNPVARKVIAQLVSAVAGHRSAVTSSRRPITVEDRRLWGILDAVGLDPLRHPPRRTAGGGRR